jgi:RNA polymerase sigma factor (sigma-70 family)
MSEATAGSGIRPTDRLTRVLSDGRLAERAVKGDERAFAAIFRRYHQSLYRFCLAVTGDSQDAEDALQNTMVKVLRGLPGEERRIELRPWLYRIAHNESIELLRRRRETGRLHTELAAPGPGLAEGAVVRERLRRLISDLGELPERQRGALVMRELEGLAFADIAVVLDTSPAVARQTVHEARLSLRQMDRGRSMSCETVTRALSDGDRRVLRRRDLRAHLKTCADCRGFRDEIAGRRRDLAALSPLPAAAAAGLLHGLIGGPGPGAGLVGALGGGAAQSIGTSAVLKGAATVAVAAAIGAGVGAAHNDGLIGGGPHVTPATPPHMDGAAPPSHLDESPPRAPLHGAAVESGAIAHLGATPTKPATDKPTKLVAVEPAASREGQTAVEPTAAPTPTPIQHVPGPAPSRGGDHAEELPRAAAHGQQTAAAHKAATHGSSGGRGHPAYPAKPAHPAHPTHPTHPSAPGPKVESTPPGKEAGHAAHGEPPLAPPAEAAEEEVVPSHGPGKKP